MYEFQVRKIENLMQYDLSDLAAEGKKDGFRFLERLIRDYDDGSNTFSDCGEAIYGVFNKERVIIAIGGLNVNPFSYEQRIARLRRFYVSKAYRRKGVGRLLLNNIKSYAKMNFDVLVLHTDTKQGDQFYTSFGFTKADKYSNSTHYLMLKE
ncbi:GNAT family N-acetyltransferase [Halobacillus sp. BBL2006]|uniref:GNAT family N-acetyltransferase n=1 Tax=Halobacillus sp. BBL2006 TaxID=1543706 RepID=UPI000541D361|nr:GNAT family N-acetyltransferase [Halobacillus sp. BBL2006]KHE72031.1 GNAT family acetyltransferase [Halobacillus sp. BBL2006]